MEEAKPAWGVKHKCPICPEHRNRPMHLADYHAHMADHVETDMREAALDAARYYQALKQIQKHIASRASLPAWRPINWLHLFSHIVEIALGNEGAVISIEEVNAPSPGKEGESGNDE